MSDFIKEFNMIDILGMMLPGAILLLLFGEEFEFLLYLSQRIGSDEPPTAIITVVLLIGGYMVGMLLHEIGDMIEKIIWHNPLLNPRTYAAFSTGLYEKEKGRNDNTIDKKLKSKFFYYTTTLFQIRCRKRFINY